MKIQEADAKSLLVAQGLPVPAWELARTPGEVKAAAQRFFDAGNARVVIKAQVLVGGRGKAGGVKLAASADEAAEVGSRILGMDIKGITVRKVIVGGAVDITKEYYLGAIIDRATRRIVLMASAEGGVEIEEVARANPGAIHRVSADPQLGLLAFQARGLGLAVGLRDSLLNQFVVIAQGLYATMKANDADLVEINPLAVVAGTATGGSATQQLVCLDAKIT
ncbi:MAG TPA: ATP-grasp domain-containing protein, partial [Candidatus Limnocylindrales bacterium]